MKNNKLKLIIILQIIALLLVITNHFIQVVFKYVLVGGVFLLGFVLNSAIIDVIIFLIVILQIIIIILLIDEEVRR